MKKLRITLEGKTYEVEVEPIGASYVPQAYSPPPAAAPRPVAAPKPVPAAPVAAAPAASTGGGHPVTSPMPGLVMKVRVAVGQQVAKDEEIVVLEAMKMESSIYAPSAGTVAAILVKEGEAVSEGQVLVQLS